MKEDLNLYQNQYNYIIVAWTVGYIIGQWVCIIIHNHAHAHAGANTMFFFFDSHRISS